MPSLDLFLYFQDDLKVQKVTYVNGIHYSRCLEDWLALQDKQRAELMPLFKVRSSGEHCADAGAGFIIASPTIAAITLQWHCRTPTGLRAASGSCTGGCSTLLVASCSSTTGARNGAWHITCL
jgi:hypothetical protein